MSRQGIHSGVMALGRREFLSASGVEAISGIRSVPGFQIGGQVLGPAVDVFLVDLVDLGTRVYSGIGAEGHFTFSDLFHDLGEEELLFFQ